MKSLPTCTFLNNIGDCPSSIDSPLQVKLINFLGLKNYMIDNFIFSRKPSKYIIRKCNKKNTIITGQQGQYTPPTGYRIQVKIIQTSQHSVPILRLIPRHKNNNCVIIYAHGNSSDMTDSLAFVERLSQHIKSQFIVFDYTGYGESRVRDVGEEVICGDLEILLAWIKNKQGVNLQNVILWGFSLGTYPVVVNASKYQQIGAIILQCPIASICCLFHAQLHEEMKFKQDHFANINYIEEVKSKILIMHSNQDEIIPFGHGKLLYKKYLMKNGVENIDFIEIGGGARHNSLHKFIVSGNQNVLQKEVFQFLNQFMYQKAHKISTIAQLSMKSIDSIPQSLLNNYQPSHISFLQQKQKQKYQKNSSNKKLPNNFDLTRNSLINKHKIAQNQKRLSELRMKITEADIPELVEDMQEIIVDQQRQKQIQKQKQKQKQKERMLTNNSSIDTMANQNSYKTKTNHNQESKYKGIREKLMQERLMKNCFCFPNNL